MARFVTGKTFGTTETVTAALLNQAVNDAAISTDSVDNSTIEVNSNALRLKDSSSKTTGVTFAKMQHISTAKVLGRVSASEGDVEEAFDFKDEDDMSSNSATALASQQSIKAYVDGEITDHGITQTTGSAPYFGVRAWAYYNGTSNSLVENGNIASVTKHGTGDYEFFFDVAMPDVNYAISLSYSNEVNNQHGVGFVSGHATGSCRIQFYNAANSSNTMDKAYVAISIIR